MRAAAAAGALLCACGCASTRVTLEDLEAQVAREREAVAALEQAAALAEAAAHAVEPAEAPIRPPQDPATILAFYETERPRLEIPATARREHEVRALVERLSVEGALGFTYLDEGGSIACSAPCDGEAGLAGVPLYVLRAAAFAAARELRGAEIDLIVRVGGGGHLVTVWHEHDGRLVAQDAPRVGLPAGSGPGPPPDPGELSLRYGLAGIDAGSRPWADDERGVLALALSLLSERERGLLRDLTFRREAAPADPAHSDLGGAHLAMPGAGRIIVYDAAFVGADHGFEGVLRSPYPSSTHAILHQIGHVIAAASAGPPPERIAEHAAAVERASQQLRRLRNRSKSRDPERMAELAREIEGLRQRLDRLPATNAASAGAAGPLERFARVLPEGTGPTPYGRSSVDESFAEAFALCRLDAEACRRISFDLLAFFSAQLHLPPR